MVGARSAALQPGRDQVPNELQVAFLVDRWGAETILGPRPNLFELIQLGKLLNVYNVFKRKARHGIKSLDASDKQLMADVMIMASELKTDDG